MASIYETRANPPRLLEAKDAFLDHLTAPLKISWQEIRSFDVRYVPGLAAADKKTVDVMSQLSLYQDGLIRLPFFMVVPTNGMIRIRGTDNLQCRFERFDGDMEAVPSMTIGFENEDHHFVELESFHLFSYQLHPAPGKKPFFVLRWEAGRSASGKRKKQMEVFPLAEKYVPDESLMTVLFDDKGWMRSHEHLKIWEGFLKRTVSFNPNTLEGAEHTWYTKAYTMLENHDMRGFIEVAAHKLQLAMYKSQKARFDGDIRAHAVLTKVGGVKQLVITIEDILVPKPSNHRQNLALIVRPKEGQDRGTLALYIPDNGDIQVKVFRNKEVDQSIDAVGFDQPQALAIILTKLEMA